MKIIKSRVQKISRKKIRALCKLWADNDDEYSEYCSLSFLKELGGATSIDIVQWLISLELEKCKKYGCISDEGARRMLGLFMSNDMVIRSMALERIHYMREKRLNYL